MKRKSRSEADAIGVAAPNLEAYGALSEAVGDRRREPGHLVVLGTHRELPGEAALAEFARVMELDVYTARQRLLAPTPRIVRREDREAEAQRWVDVLSAKGLRAFRVSEEEFARQELIVQGELYSKDSHFLFERAGDARLAVPRADVACVVVGEVSERTVAVSTASQGMLAGAPMRENLSAHAQMVIDIHLRSSPVGIRLEQDSFRFQVFDHGATGGSAILVRQLLHRLRQALPGTPFCEQFAAASMILGASEQIVSNSSYIVTSWARPGPRMRLVNQKTVSESTVLAFDIYSALCRLETLRG